MAPGMQGAAHATSVIDGCSPLDNGKQLSMTRIAMCFELFTKV